MKRHLSGVSLLEVVVAVSVSSLVTLGIYQVTRQVNSLNRANEGNQSMEEYSTTLYEHMVLKLKSCGDGLRGNPDPTLGKTVIAPPDLAFLYGSYMPEIIFLAKDQAPIGSLGPEDLWVRYSSSTQNGITGILERTYQADSWTNIKNNVLQPIDSKFYPLPSGIKLAQLGFTLYDSQDPPRISNQDPNSSSAVRFTLQLVKDDHPLTFSKIIMLENLLYGPN